MHAALALVSHVARILACVNQSLVSGISCYDTQFKCEIIVQVLKIWAQAGEKITTCQSVTEGMSLDSCERTASRVAKK